MNYILINLVIIVRFILFMKDNKDVELYLFDYTSRQVGDDTIYILR